MSSYYIYAKNNKQNRYLKVPIESKHKYFMGVVSGGEYFALRYIQVDKPHADPNAGGAWGTGTKFTSIDAKNISLLFAGSQFHLVQNGVDGEGEFIGDKIFLKDLVFTISLNLNYSFVELRNTSEIITAFNYSDTTPPEILRTITQNNTLPHKPFYANFRLMLVKFNDPLDGDTNGYYLDVNGSNAQKTKDDLAKWFNQSRIYLDSSAAYDAGNEAGTNLNECEQPVFTDMLRDSSLWTNKFKILMDEKIKLTDSNPSIFISKKLDINKNVNLLNEPTAGGFTISGDTLKNVYLFIIGPTCSTIDVDPETRKLLVSMTGSYQNLANCMINTKSTYYDV